jgi:hypothetical protein
MEGIVETPSTITIFKTEDSYDTDLAGCLAELCNIKIPYKE